MGVQPEPQRQYGAARPTVVDVALHSPTVTQPGSGAMNACQARSLIVDCIIATCSRVPAHYRAWCDPTVDAWVDVRGHAGQRKM
jgi:hypothetical protein